MTYLLGGHTCSFGKLLLLQVFFVPQLQANTPSGYLKEQSNTIVEFCNKNGHRNLVLTTIDHDSGDVKEVLLHLLRNSNSFFAVPKSSNDVIAHQCQNTQCHRAYKDIMHHSSFLPTLHESKQRATLIILASASNTSDWKTYLTIITKRKPLTTIFVISFVSLYIS